MCLNSYFTKVFCQQNQDWKEPFEKGFGHIGETAFNMLPVNVGNCWTEAGLESLAPPLCHYTKTIRINDHIRVRIIIYGTL